MAARVHTKGEQVEFERIRISRIVNMPGYHVHGIIRVLQIREKETKKPAVHLVFILKQFKQIG